MEFIVVKSRKQLAIIAVVGNVDVDGKVKIDEMMRQGELATTQLNSGYSICGFLRSKRSLVATVTLYALKFDHVCG